jgi:hypothetical protein
LSFGFAGMVGISPRLHVAFEHGGHGPEHTHGWTTINSSAVRPVHPHPHGDATDPEKLSLQLGRPSFFVNAHRSFGLPSISIRALSQILTRFIRTSESPAGDASRPVPASPAHDHHSLAQSLACGLIEQSVGTVILEFGSVRFSFLLPVPPEVHLEPFFDAQMAGRAPPPVWS